MLAEEALAKKAIDPILLQVSALCSYADYLLIVTATSAPQAQAIAEGCMAKVKQSGLQVNAREGLGSARWILIDFGDVVLHVFQPDERGYYDLETLWVEAPRIDIPGADQAGMVPVFTSS
jgi:ribosome-associated protein